MSFYSVLQSIVGYAPIPLFAESLRVQQALVSTVLMRHSIPPGLTGCVKDFSRLWEIDDSELFNYFDSSPAAHAVSVRHGASFPVANKAILDACRMTGKKPSKTAHDYKFGRETVVNVSFLIPKISESQSRSQRWQTWAVLLATVLEIAITIVISVVLALTGELVGSALMGCVAVVGIILPILQLWTTPIFGNARALYNDKLLTVRGGAALDVHVTADNWNSSRLDVLCGYSSQLHALTNIPVRVSNFGVLQWSCRILAIVLAIQAALLASLANMSGTERWSGLVWLATYIFKLLVKRGFYILQGPDKLLEGQQSSILSVNSLHFSGRKPALVFIATLPVSRSADRWAWWDVFTPDNTRRRDFQVELEEVSNLFIKSTFEKEQARDPTEKKIQSRSAEIAVQEAAAALRNPGLVLALKSYQKVVFPSSAANDPNDPVEV